MAFWSSEKLKAKITAENLINPYDDKCIKNSAYEMGLGPEAFITSDGQNKVVRLNAREQLVIPPGQFGLLITNETVTIPLTAIGFISIKAGIKFRGLVNVSGFHVDPGFTGQLKFSVYNAGSQNIVLDSKQRVFLLWLSDLDQRTKDGYVGEHNKQAHISADDVMRIQGEVASPAALKQRLDALQSEYSSRISSVEERVKTWQGITIGLLISILVVFIKVVWDQVSARPSAPVTTVTAPAFEGTRPATLPQPNPSQTPNTSPPEQKKSEGAKTAPNKQGKQ